MRSCTGNPVGAACELLAARMLFLSGRSAWYRLGIFRVNFQPLKMKFLRVELCRIGCTWSLNECLEVGSGESAGCLKNLCRIG